MTCINGHDDCPLCKRNQQVNSLFAQFQVETDADVKVRILETMREIADEGHNETLDVIARFAKQPHFEVCSVSKDKR